MPKLRVDSGSLRTTVVPEKGERKTLVSRWVETITDTVSEGQVRLDGQAGPTVSARFYSMAGTAMYEAWQLFDPRSDSSLDLDSPRLRRLAGSLRPRRVVIENAINRSARKVLARSTSGITARGRRSLRRFYRSQRHTLGDRQ